jgi:large subunit ribosomal protein L4
VKDLAKVSALSHKAKDNAIIVLEDLSYEAPKTKQFVEVLKNINAAGKKVLFVLPDYNDNVYLSLRNLPRIGSTLLADINTYDVINADLVVFTENAAKILNEKEEVAA